jgi:hypothetical protein
MTATPHCKPWGNNLQDAGFYTAKISGTVAKVKMNAILLNILPIFWQPIFWQASINDHMIPIPNQSGIFVGSSSAPQRTTCTPSSPRSSPP